MKRELFIDWENETALFWDRFFDIVKADIVQEMLVLASGKEMTFAKLMHRTLHNLPAKKHKGGIQEWLAE